MAAVRAVHRLALTAATAALVGFAGCTPTVTPSPPAAETPRTSADTASSGPVTSVAPASSDSASPPPPSTQVVLTPRASSRTPTPTARGTAHQFSASITPVTAAQLASSWRPGCPVAVADLRAVEVTHWDVAGGVRTGRLVVAAAHAEAVVAILRDLFEARFPIERMEPVEAFGGSDDASMAANNTSAFNCRNTTGGSSWSEHSYGRAIDVNPLLNPYVRGALVLPPAGAAHLDRSRPTPGMIRSGDAVVHAFAARGWIWGGTWTSPKDYQHFSTTGR